jgi:hypothetical protein
MNTGNHVTEEIELSNQKRETMGPETKGTYVKFPLFLIGIGVWVIVLQNAGVITTKYKVHVESGNVGVKGSVSVDNTVSVSIDEVLGRDGGKYYFNNRR